MPRAWEKNRKREHLASIDQKSNSMNHLSLAASCLKENSKARTTKKHNRASLINSKGIFLPSRLAKIHLLIMTLSFPTSARPEVLVLSPKLITRLLKSVALYP